MQAIKIVELVKRYKSLTAVDKLNLEIQQGELFSLLGVNGAGKTTTIKMLSCLIKPTDGDAIVGGYSVTKEPEQVKRLIGVSPQETAVAPNLSVKENLELICGIHGFSKQKTEEKIKELVTRFRHIVTVEEHTIVGGFGSAVCEAAAELGTGCRIHRIGMEDVYSAIVGTQQYLREHYEMDAKSIAERTEKWLNQP